MNKRQFRCATGRLTAATLVLTLLSLTGCGESGPKTYEVNGKVVFEGGDVKQLAGSNVELQLKDDPKVRAYAAIKEDGNFTVEMLDKGKIRQGAFEGDYQARIIFATESDVDVKCPINARFLKFETSGLTYKVPAEGDITVTVTK